MVDLRRLVVVGQDDRVALPLEPLDLGDVGGVEVPLDLGHDPANALVEGVDAAEVLGGGGRRAHGVHFSPIYTEHSARVPLPQRAARKRGQLLPWASAVDLPLPGKRGKSGAPHI